MHNFKYKFNKSSPSKLLNYVIDIIENNDNLEVNDNDRAKTVDNLDNLSDKDKENQENKILIKNYLHFLVLLYSK